MSDNKLYEERDGQFTFIEPRKEVRRMKLYRKNFVIWKNSIDILPSLTIRWNDPEYILKTFSIEFHWIVFHARFLWLKES